MIRRIVMASVVLALVAGVLHANLSEEFRYGNWCGKNYPKDTSTVPAPVNRVDQECMKHDLAYGDKPYRADSDAELARNLAAIANSGEIEGKELAWAVAIATAFNGLQYINLRNDLLHDHKVSSVVDSAVTTGVSAVALPTAATAGVIDKVSNVIGGPVGKPISWTADVVRFPGSIAIAGGKFAGKVQEEGSSAWRSTKNFVKKFF